MKKVQATRNFAGKISMCAGEVRTIEDRDAASLAARGLVRVICDVPDEKTKAKVSKT